MIASTRCRSQFGNGRGCFSSLRAGRTRVRPRSGLVKNSSVSPPDRPLSVTTAVPGAGRFAGWCRSICRACWRSPYSLGLARPNPVTVPSQVQISSSLLPQYQREWLGQYPYPAYPNRSERRAVTTDWPHETGVASISRTSSAVAGVASASHRSAASISGAAALSRVLYSDWHSSRGNRCPTCLAAARSQRRSSSNRSSTWATAMQTSSASVTSGRWPGPLRVNPRPGIMRSVSSTYSAIRRVSRSAVMTGSRVRTCVNTPILDALRMSVTNHSQSVAPGPSHQARNPDQRSRGGGWREGSGGCFQGHRVAECFQAGDEAAGLALGVQAAGEVIAAELVVGFAGGQDVPDDHEDGVGDDDDGFVLGNAGAVAAPFHDVPVVEGLEVALMPDRGPGALDQDGLEVLVAFP